MWTKEFVSKMGRLVVRGLVRWLEMLGENPPLSRDHGFLVWQALHQDEVRGRGERLPGNLADTLPSARPGLVPGAAPLGWVPPLEPPSGPLHRAI